jgi:hypothetical protein
LGGNSRERERGRINKNEGQKGVVVFWKDGLQPCLQLYRTIDATAADGSKGSIDARTISDWKTGHVVAFAIITVGAITPLDP